MHLAPRRLALASAILCGTLALAAWLANFTWPAVGVGLLETLRLIPLPAATPVGLAVPVTVALAAVEGAVCGAAIGWLSNRGGHGTGNTRPHPQALTPGHVPRGFASLSQSSGGSATQVGIYAEHRVLEASSVPAQSLMGYLKHLHTEGSVGVGYGVEGFAHHAGQGGTSLEMRGVSGSVFMDAEGTIVRATALYAGALRVTKGTVAQNHGIYVEPQTAGAANFALLTNGGAWKNNSIDSIVCSGAALPTDAAGGFLYVPSCEGRPTGTPARESGTVPIVYDTQADVLYAYHGRWRALAEGRS